MRSYRDLLIADRVVQAYSLTETASPPINIVQTAPTGHTTSGTTVTATLSNTPSSANMLIAVCCGYSGTGVPATRPTVAAAVACTTIASAPVRVEASGATSQVPFCAVSGSCTPI